jgi:predicted alpha/beta superfamily hydrolase
MHNILNKRMAGFIALAYFLSSCAHPQPDTKVVIGNMASIHSKILNEDRKIWVHVPDDNGGGNFAKEKYPVVYLLDGDAHFSSVVGMIEQLSTVNGNTVCPKMIVVGIPNTDRTRDLTPTRVYGDPPYMDSSATKTSGGGEAFTGFIEKELMPYIDSLYPTAPYKVLIGHSFGGLTAMNTFIHHTRLFNAYIVIDPSMWWDKQKLLGEAKVDLAEKKYDGESLFLGIANTMEKGMDTARIKTDTNGMSRHIRSILTLRTYFKDNPNNGLRFNYKYYRDDDHGSVPLITEYDGLHFIFDFYKLSLDFKAFFDPKERPDTLLSAHYRLVSDRLGYAVMPPEDLVNSLGYRSLQLKQYEKAKNLFAMNVKSYPQSPNVYDSMGDFFSETGDKAKAIENYKKALAIKENGETRSKLEKLLK